MEEKHHIKEKNSNAEEKFWHLRKYSSSHRKLLNSVFTGKCQLFGMEKLNMVIVGYMAMCVASPFLRWDQVKEEKHKVSGA